MYNNATLFGNMAAKGSCENKYYAGGTDFRKMIVKPQ